MSKSFIIKKEDMITSQWAGGETTELFIYPKSSSLKELDFVFRLSTASVNVEKSIFTSLKDVNRKLMLLEGELKLEHKDHHSKQIPVFDVDKFQGDWLTTSFGKATNLNLMTTKDYQSKLSAFIFAKDSELKDKNYACYTFLFLYKGSVNTSFGEMQEGDLLVIGDKELYKMWTNETSTLVHISISLFD